MSVESKQELLISNHPSQGNDLEKIISLTFSLIPDSPPSQQNPEEKWIPTAEDLIYLRYAEFE